MNKGLSIKDLENLSGIKAHTIRIWEKRYNILDPKRTNTNIRYYDTQDLTKLLNITSILDSGMRISKVSALTKDEINQQILEIKSENIHGAKKIIVNELIG
ncbi:MAG: MerR family transcriptional regulator, partial [Bacteroidia bacterium]